MTNLTPEYDSDGDGTVEADVDNHLVNTESLSNAETVTPPPDADLPTFVSNHGGQIIDLGWRTFVVDTNVDVPSDTTLRNGRIEVDPDAGQSDFTPDAVVSTPDGSDRESIFIQNIEIPNAGDALIGGIHLQDCRWTTIVNSVIHDSFKAGIKLSGKHSNGIEGNGPSIVNPRVWESNREGIWIDADRDYATIFGGAVDNCATNVQIDGENTTVFGSAITGAGSYGIDNTANKLKVFAATLNHNSRAMRATGCERLTVVGTQALVIPNHAFVLDGVQNSGFGFNWVGRAGNNNTGDAFNLISDSQACTGNTFALNNGEVYGSGQATTRYAINEADSGASGNKIIGNDAGNAAQNWNLNSGDVRGNTPRPTFDATPSSVENWREVVATSSWDPNSTGGDSLVLTKDGGSSWVTVATL